MAISPPSGAVFPLIMSRRVVFPLPFLPIRPIYSPGAMPKETPFKISLDPQDFFMSFRDSRLNSVFLLLGPVLEAGIP